MVIVGENELLGTNSFVLLLKYTIVGGVFGCFLLICHHAKKLFLGNCLYQVDVQYVMSNPILVSLICLTRCVAKISVDTKTALDELTIR